MIDPPQRVIGLENQQVVGPARQDLLGDCGRRTLPNFRNDVLRLDCFVRNNGLAAPRLNRPRCRRRKLLYPVPSAAGRTLADGQLNSQRRDKAQEALLWKGRAQSYP